MEIERSHNVTFKKKISLAIIELIREGKKRSPKNLALKSNYSLREIELNLYEIGLMIDTLEDVHGS